VRSDAVPYRELMGAHDRVALLRTVPLDAKLVVPRRPLAALPGPLAVAARGDVEATLDVGGTLAAPHATFSGHARDVGVHDATDRSLVGADVDADYDGRQANAKIVVRSTHAELLDGEAHVDARVDRLADWSGRAKLDMHAFPLQRVSALSDLGIRGKITGSASLDDLHRAATARVDVAVDGLQIGDVRYTAARLSVGADGGAIRASARVEQTDGFLDAGGHVGVAWGKALLPSIDEAKPIDVAVMAKSLRLSAAQPFVDAALVDVDGRLDADVRLAIDPSAPAAAAQKTLALSGTATLTDGVVQLASMGTRLQRARARVTMTPDGTVRIDDVEAHGVTGLVTGSAVAHLSGLRLESAKAEVKVPDDKPIALDVSGAQMGDVYGNVQVTAQRSADGKRMAVAVGVPSLHVQLPLAAAHGVNDRPVADNVHVGVYTAGGFELVRLTGRSLTTAPPPEPATIYEIAVDLGRDVEIKRGATLKVGLQGKSTVTRGAETTVAGQIRLKSGSFQVQGKKFEIESGTVTFSGTDASNPLVVVTAGWTAADGTRVFADFKGPLKTGKVTLRSEPPRTRDEILALILFGSADEASTAPYAQGGSASRAGSVAGGLATQGLSDGLDELTGLEIATKIDTSNSANPRPEVEVQIARTISLQIAFVLGTPPPGANPDKTFATVDWRFARQWSLETTFGDQGSSLADLVWQYRY
jgi:translocation and assembly module TamB